MSYIDVSRPKRFLNTGVVQVSGMQAKSKHSEVARRGFRRQFATYQVFTFLTVQLLKKLPVDVQECTRL